MNDQKEGVVAYTRPPEEMTALEQGALSNYLSVDEVVGQTLRVQEVMSKVMKVGHHYGKIPGCGPKPSLLKPGAEKLSLTFRLRPKFRIERHDLPQGHREYEITCELYNQVGDFMGEGVGVCSTMETRYRWRKGDLACPECGMIGAVIKGKEEYGGGWICFKKKDGCGAKFEDEDPLITEQDTERREHDNPADYYNTAKKISKKRSFVDGILTVTATSDIFAQDLEDVARTQTNLEMADEDMLAALTALADDEMMPPDGKSYIWGQLDGDALTMAHAQRILKRGQAALKLAKTPKTPEGEREQPEAVTPDGKHVAPDPPKTPPKRGPGSRKKTKVNKGQTPHGDKVEGPHADDIFGKKGQ